MSENRRTMRTAIVGGGAAGFFLAVNLKEMCPQMDVVIFERGRKLLAKVEVSGGGRCNCTNSFARVSDLQQVYPRGHRLLGRLFHVFGPRDAYAWFEQRGVALITQADECVFPASQDAHTIIDCFMREARRLGVHIVTETKVQHADDLAGFDFVAVTVGGQPRREGLKWLEDMGHKVEPPVPSLFSLAVADSSLNSLMGTVAGQASVLLPTTKYRALGPLLITHWGLSGPAILKLSSHAARWLSACGYQCELCVNWTGQAEEAVSAELLRQAAIHPQKQLASVRPFDLPQRLWSHLLARSLGERSTCRWAELGKKGHHQLVNVLCSDVYAVKGRAAFRDEFVTCGGVALSSVSPKTLESKCRPGLFFAGEVLDIDGVTGGFNFQAAWTTAYVVAQSIAHRVKESEE